LGTFYASHVYQPYVIPGYATAAIEMVEQLGGAPGSVVLPVGQGSNLLGIARGFDALVNTGLIAQGPQIIGVQSRACAPLWAATKSGIVSPDAVAEGETYAEGIRILNPLRRKEVLDAVASSRGWMEAVEEADILPGRDELAARGFHVEPTSAVVWPALIENFENLKDPIVLILTGSGLKYAPN
jgi:threonine synthase